MCIANLYVAALLLRIGALRIRRDIDQSAEFARRTPRSDALYQRIALAVGNEMIGSQVYCAMLRIRRHENG